jgi:hypothetical protein
MGCGDSKRASDISRNNRVPSTQNSPEKVDPVSKAAPVTTRTAETVDEVVFTANQFIKLNDGNLRNTYKVGKKIGDGAFGKVYVAQHRITNSKRAVKIL